jgi:hypothetical protein
MKKRDTYKSFLLKKIFKIDSTYYKPNPKFTRAAQAPMHLALVIDNIVEDIMHCDERLGYLLLSNPKVILIDMNSSVNVSDIYDEKNNIFIKSDDNE